MSGGLEAFRRKHLHIAGFSESVRSITTPCLCPSPTTSTTSAEAGFAAKKKRSSNRISPSSTILEDRGFLDVVTAQLSTSDQVEYATLEGAKGFGLLVPGGVATPGGWQREDAPPDET